MSTPDTVPAGWRRRKLGELLREVDRRASLYPEADRQALTVLSLTKSRGLIPQSERFEKRIATEDVADYKVVRRGEIVYNPFVLWEGAIHQLMTHDVGIVSPAYLVWEATAEADAEFLAHLLRTEDMLALYGRVGDGLVKRRKVVSRDVFKRLEVNAPPATIQRRIGLILRRAQAATLASTRVLEEANVVRRTYADQFMPTENAPQRYVGAHEVAAQAAGPLGTFLQSTQYGLSIRSSTDGTIPFLRMNAIQEGRLRTDNLVRVTLDEATLAANRLNVGDLLFNRTNSRELVGKVALFDLPGDWAFASYLVRLCADESRVKPRYLAALLNTTSVQADIRRLASAAVGQSNINPSKLKTVRIVLPSLEDQQIIVDILSAIDAKIDAERKRLAALEDLYRALLHDLMTGALRVDDPALPRAASQLSLPLVPPE